MTECPDCAGTGSTPVAHCLRCGGTGFIPSVKSNVVSLELVAALEVIQDSAGNCRQQPGQNGPEQDALNAIYATARAVLDKVKP